MTKSSKLRRLSHEDQKRVLELCDKHTYDEVVILVAKPRGQGGLDLKTNRSALSRFTLDHGPVSAHCQLASQFIDLLDQQPLDLEDVVSPLAHLVGQAAFVLAAQNRPYDEYRRLIDTFLRLERVSREREKLWHEREAHRRAQVQRTNANAPLEIAHASIALPNPKPAQSPTPPPAPIKLDYALTSFKTPPPKSSSLKPGHESNPGKSSQAQTLQIPDVSSIFSDISSKNSGNLTNLTRSHITTSPSTALPCP